MRQGPTPAYWICPIKQEGHPRTEICVTVAKAVISLCLGRAVEVAPPFFNGVFNTCVGPRHSETTEREWEKDFSWQGSLPDITPKLRSPRAWLRFHLVAISQHVAAYSQG
jgi:hypothetical protein